jgi:hypothetical protein
MGSFKCFEESDCKFTRTYYTMTIYDVIILARVTRRSDTAAGDYAVVEVDRSIGSLLLRCCRRCCNAAEVYCRIGSTGTPPGGSASSPDCRLRCTHFRDWQMEPSLAAAAAVGDCCCCFDR